MRLRYFIRKLQVVAGLVAFCCAGNVGTASAADPAAEQSQSADTSSSTTGLEDTDFLRSDLSSIARKAPEKPLSFDSLLQRSGPMINMPPPPLNLPNRQTRELLDERRNWVFVSPDDVIQNFMSRQSLQLPEYGLDGQPKDLTVVERYYERMQRSRGITNGIPGRQKSLSGLDNSDDPNPFTQFSELPSLRTSYSGLGLDEKASKGSLRPNSFSDLFGTADKSATDSFTELRERQRSERHLDAFRQALDFGAPPGADPLPNLFAPNPKPAAAPLPSQAQLPSYATLQQGYDPATIMNLPTAPVAPVAPISPGQPVPSPYSQFAPPPKTMPTRQEFTIPQRRF
jgi:hypothetical protein